MIEREKHLKRNMRKPTPTVNMLKLSYRNNKKKSFSSNSELFDNTDTVSESMSFKECLFGSSFKLYMNHLVQYPKNPPVNYLVTFRDFTSDSHGPAEAALFTTFGYEQEFFTKLLKYAKVIYN